MARPKKTEQPAMELKTETKVEEAPKVVVNKEVVKGTVKGNLTHLQPKDRIINTAKRNSKNEQTYPEINATDFNVVYETIQKGVKTVVDASRFVWFVEQSQELITSRKNLEEALTEERCVRMVDTSSFVNAARSKFLYPLDIDSNGNLIYNFNADKFDASAVFSILSNMNEKLIEERFYYLLLADNGVPLNGILKTKKIKQIIAELSNVRMGGVLISAKDILHIPNFEKVDINSI